MNLSEFVKKKGCGMTQPELVNYLAAKNLELTFKPPVR